MKNILCFICLFVSGVGYSQQTTKNVDALAFKKLVDEKKAVIIDLRTDDEIARKGIIKGAIQIDYFSEDAEAAIGKMDRDQPYLIYCAGGGRSGECGD